MALFRFLGGPVDGALRHHSATRPEFKVALPPNWGKLSAPWDRRDASIITPVRVANYIALDDNVAGETLCLYVGSGNL